LEYEPDLAVSTEIGLKNRPKHVFDLPTSDVVIAYADSRDPDLAVEMALELQSKNRGAGIILALSGLRDDMARRFSAYAGSWSLITSRTSADPVKLTFVIQSAARGMSIVEPAVTKMIEAGWHSRAMDELEPDVSGLTNVAEAA
jgi:hypothetical protein